jgi:hypothetical protein
LADRSAPFPRFSFQSDGSLVDLKDFGDGSDQSAPHWRQLRDFRLDDAIEIDQPKAGLANFFPCQAEHIGRIATSVGRIGVGEHLADVAKICRPQKCVGDGVQKEIGVRVAHEMSIAVDIDAAQSHRASGSQSMGIKSNANAQVIHPAIFLPDLLAVCHPDLATPWGG